MTSPGIMNDGLTLMLFGMGSVFIFLTLLVFATTVMSKVVAKYAPEEAPKPAAPAPVPAQAGALDDQTLLAVISAAIQKHRSHQK